MDLASIREEVKLKLTGGLLELELDDETIDRIINSALRELQRYMASLRYVTVPFGRCIELNDVRDEYGKAIKVSSVSKVFRSEGTVSTDGTGVSQMDPMQASQWQLVSGLGNMNNFQSYSYNLSSWLTLLQIRNTLSTDLIFTYDRDTNRLYVNISSGTPRGITIAYVPRYDSVEDVVSDFWIDNLVQMSIILTKIAVGRIRSRYTESGALWTQDGSTILSEGLEEYKTLVDHLQENMQLSYGID